MPDRLDEERTWQKERTGEVNLYVKLCCANDYLYSSGDENDEPVWVRRHGKWVKLNKEEGEILYPGGVFRTQLSGCPSTEFKFKRLSNKTSMPGS